MLDKPLLLPNPQQISMQDGGYNIPNGKFILLDSPNPGALRFTASRLQTALKEFAGVEWDIVASTVVPHARVGVFLSLAAGATQHPQGYNLTITSEAIYIVASTPTGLFYAMMTLNQLLQQYGRSLPAVRIVDWPDFPNRGLMLDISRNKVPTMETLYNLVDMLASWKINQIQLYTEHTFAYQRHPKVWAQASPMTGAEILALDAYCQKRFIELVPNQNSFGHLHHWLEIEEYTHLAEAPEGAETPWGFFREGPFSLAPLLPESLDLVRDMFDELLPHFSSPQFNVGLDETYDIGQGKSKEAVDELGVGRIYLDYLLKIYREVKARGLTMQFWGDIIVHHPDLVRELPHDVIALEWGYDAAHPFDEHGAIFADSGVPFYVCPGTSTWNTLVGRTDNAITNLLSAAENGRKHGAIGYLNTEWGDRGHWQPLPANYLGFGYGAAVSWATDANRDLDIPATISYYAFGDSSGAMGRFVYEMGNIYQIPGIILHNSSVLFHILQTSPDDLDRIKEYAEGELDLEKYQQTSAAIDQIMGRLSDNDMQVADANLIKQEFTWAADMLRHACQRLAWLLGEEIETQSLLKDAERLIAEYEVIWHARNRPGGFSDSVGRMETMKSYYEEK